MTGPRGWECALRATPTWSCSPFRGPPALSLRASCSAVKVSAKGKHVKCKIDLERCLFWDPAGSRRPGEVRLGQQVHRLALLLQPRHNGPGQVRLSGARPVSSRELPATVPPPLLRLHARRPAAAQQRLRLFHAVDRRAVRVAQRLQRPQPLREALRQPLRQQAVRLCLR